MKVKYIGFVAILILSLMTVGTHQAYAITAVFQQGVSGYTGSEDNELSADNPNTVYATGGAIYPDRESVRFCGARCNNTIIRFKNLGITGTISSITLSIKEVAQQGGSDFLYAKKVSRADWETAGVTWNNYKAGSAWTTPGGDSGAAIATTSALGGPGWIDFNLGTDFTIAELEQNGILLESSIPGFSYVFFYSNEASTPADRPKLTIVYNTAPDTTPPTVSITSPRSGAVVSGSIPVTATAADNDEVAGVTFKVDGVTVGTEDTVAPYSISLNTASLTNGSHTITATARDSSNNQTTSSGETITVNNVTPPPTVSLSASPTSVTSGNSATLTWSSTNATSCTATGGWTGSKATSGSQSTGALTTSTIFTLACTGVSGTISRSVMVNVPSNITPLNTGLKMDLSYVNQGSAEFARLKTLVDNAIAGAPDYGFSPTHAALMYKITGDVQYADFAIAYVENCPNSFEFNNYQTPCGVVRAEAAIALGNAPLVAADSYLEAGEIIGSLALVYDWAGDRMTQQQKTRWAAYANQTIYNIWNPSLASWGGTPRPWTGWSINNPGNNYYYSFVQATMYWALASRDATMLSFVRNQKLQPLLDYYAQIPGGGSLEGTGYGTAHMNMFFLHKVWKDSTGEDTANANNHLTDSIKFWLHATLPGRSHYAPIGDLSRDPNPTLFDYHRRLMLIANHLTSSTANKDIASWWLRNVVSSPTGNPFNRMSRAVDSQWDLFSSGSFNGATPNEPLSYNASGVGRVFARTGWDTSALWMTFTAGKYNESHAHQDQGSFTLAAGGVGAGNTTPFLTVTNNIFSSSGINQTTDYHNILRFVNNGNIIPQVTDTESMMTVNSLTANGEADITANLAPAYGGNAAIQSWSRNVKFLNRKLTVTDSFNVSGGTEAIFQMGVPNSPVVNGNEITAGALNIRVLSPASPTINVVNQEGKYRIDISGGSSEYIVEMSDQVLPSNPVPFVSFTASSQTINQGASTTLSWTSSDATSCTATGGWTGARATTGNQSVSPSTTTVYTLSCTGAGGTTLQNVTVNVNVPAPIVENRGGSVPLFFLPTTPRTGTPITTSPSSQNQSSSNASSSPSSGSKIKTTIKLNVRSEASLGNNKVCEQPLGSLGTIVDGPIAKNGYQWWKINYDNGCDGWSVQNYLILN